MPTHYLKLPDVPTGVAATGLDNALQITWDPVAGADSYNVYVAREAGVTPDNFAGKLGSQKFTDVTSPYTTPTTLASGEMYYAVVSSIGLVGESGASNEATARPARTKKSRGWS